MLNVLIGMIIGGGGVFYYAYAKIKKIRRVANDVIDTVRDLRKAVNDYKKYYSDGVISEDEMKKLLSDCDEIVMDIEDDIKALKGVIK